MNCCRSSSNDGQRTGGLFAIILLVILSCCGCNDQSSESLAKVNRNVKYDFGIVERGENVNIKIEIENRDYVVWIPKVVRPSCKCMLPSLETKRVEPGEVLKMNVAYTAPPVESDENRHIVIELDAPAEPIRIDIGGRVRDELSVLPAEIEFLDGATSEQMIVARNYGNELWEDFYAESLSKHFTVRTVVKLPPDKRVLNGAIEAWQVGVVQGGQTRLYASIESAIGIFANASGNLLRKEVNAKIVNHETIQAIPGSLVMSRSADSNLTFAECKILCKGRNPLLDKDKIKIIDAPVWLECSLEVLEPGVFELVTKCTANADRSQDNMIVLTVTRVDTPGLQVRIPLLLINE